MVLQRANTKITVKTLGGENPDFPPCFSVYIAHTRGKVPLDLTCGWIIFIVQLFTDVCQCGSVRVRWSGSVMGEGRFAGSCNEVVRM